MQTPAQRGAQVPLHARAPAVLPDHAVLAAALRSESAAVRRREGRAVRHAGEVTRATPTTRMSLLSREYYITNKAAFIIVFVDNKT